MGNDSRTTKQKKTELNRLNHDENVQRYTTEDTATNENTETWTAFESQILVWSDSSQSETTKVHARRQMNRRVLSITAPVCYSVEAITTAEKTAATLPLLVVLFPLYETLKIVGAGVGGCLRAADTGLQQALQAPVHFTSPEITQLLGHSDTAFASCWRSEKAQQSAQCPSHDKTPSVSQYSGQVPRGFSSSR